MTLHKNAYFCAKLQKKVDLGELGDIIIGLIIVGAALWSGVISPILEYLKKERAKQSAPAARRPKSAPRAKRKAPAPLSGVRTDFRPWAASEPDEAPDAVETRVSPFISGEEGVRVTTDEDFAPVTAGEMPSEASAFTDCDSEELRRGIIWGEILRPKYKD